MFVFPKMNISTNYEHKPCLSTLPGRQCVSLSIVVAMFLCCTRHCCSSSIELMSWNIRVNAKTFFNFNRITIARAFGLHLCRHPEDVCWCQLPDSERKKKDEVTEVFREPTALFQHPLPSVSVPPLVL